MAKREFRMPEVKTPEDVMALTTLTDEEKELALLNLKKIALSDGWLMLGNDPELQAIWAMIERALTALLYPDFQGLPFSPMNMILTEVARLHKSDYQYGLAIHLTSQEITQFKDEIPDTDMAHAKIGAYENPDLELWTEDERTTIKFIDAVVLNEMTDELFEKALALWGEKKTLRIIAWIGFVQSWAYMIESFGMYYDPVTMSMPNGMPPEACKHVTENFLPIRDALIETWKNLSDF